MAAAAAAAAAAEGRKKSTCISRADGRKQKQEAAALCVAGDIKLAIQRKLAVQKPQCCSSPCWMLQLLLIHTAHLDTHTSNYACRCMMETHRTEQQTGHHCPAQGRSRAGSAGRHRSLWSPRYEWCNA
jgi:hypothetical protein